MPLFLRALSTVFRSWRGILALTGLVVATGFSGKVFVDELADSATRLWWLAAMVCTVVLGREVIRAYSSLKGETISPDGLAGGSPTVSRPRPIHSQESADQPARAKPFSEEWKASLALRLLGVLAVTIAATFVVVVTADNNELRKLVEDTTARSCLLVTSAAVAILGTNYLLAHQGRNLMDWRTELVIAASLILLMAGLSLPYVNETDIWKECRFWERWFGCESTVIDEQPDWHFLWTFALQVPLTIYAGLRIHRFVTQPRGTSNNSLG